MTHSDRGSCKFARPLGVSILLVLLSTFAIAQQGGPSQAYFGEPALSPDGSEIVFDIPVRKPIGEGLAGRDSQLETAVTELLKQIGKR